MLYYNITYYNNIFMEDILKQLDISNESTKLILQHKLITNIIGLNQFINLKTLYLNCNYIIHINGLDQLINLETLELSDNIITEIKGLDKLINLKKINLNSNLITEIKGLEQLINLKELYLDDNKIIEIKGLDQLINLKTLTLANNQITEIKCLEHLIKLEIISFDNNQIPKYIYCPSNNIIKYNSVFNKIFIRRNEINDINKAYQLKRNLDQINKEIGYLFLLKLPGYVILNIINYVLLIK